jgi:hypothetical protein
MLTRGYEILSLCLETKELIYVVYESFDTHALMEKVIEQKEPEYSVSHGLRIVKRWENICLDQMIDE